MFRRGKSRRAGIVVALIAVCVGCNHAIPRFGVGGKYEEGMDQFYRGRAGNMAVAVTSLESHPLMESATIPFPAVKEHHVLAFAHKLQVGIRAWFRA